MDPPLVGAAAGAEARGEDDRANWLGCEEGSDLAWCASCVVVNGLGPELMDSVLFFVLNIFPSFCICVLSRSHIIHLSSVLLSVFSVVFYTYVLVFVANAPCRTTSARACALVLSLEFDRL